MPWQALLLSIGIYVALPLAAGYLSRRWIIKARGEEWFKEKFLHLLTPVTIVALLVTRPDLGIVAVAVWTMLSLVVHGVRLVQAIWRARRGERLTSWLA